MAKYIQARSVIQVSPHPAQAIKEENNFLVSLPTLSNQDRELHKVAVLSAHECTISKILLFASLPASYMVK